MIFQPKIRNPFSIVVLLVAAIAGFVTHVQILSQSFMPSDDNVYSYVCGLAINHSENIDAMHDQILNQLNNDNSTEEFRYRLNMRRDYTANYPFHSTVQLLSARVLNPLLGINMASYPIYISYAMVGGVIVAFAICFAIVVVGMLRFTDARSILAFTLMVLTLGSLNLLPFARLHDDIVLHNNLSDAIFHTFAFVLRTGDQNSIFSFPERSNFYMIAFLVLILRSCSLYRHAYWLSASLALFHQSLAGLFIAVVVMLDLLLRPGVLRDAYVLFALVLSAFMFMLRESLWETVGVAAIASGVTLITLISMFLVMTRQRILESQSLRSILSVRDAYVEKTGLAADVFLVLTIWILTWPIFFILMQYLDHVSAYYFWGRLHGRIWAMFFPFWIWIAFDYGLRKLKYPQYRFAIFVGCLAILILQVAHLSKQPSMTDVVARIAASLTNIEQTGFKKHIAHFDSEEDERVIYYTMAKTIDTEIDHIKYIIRRPLQY